MGGQVNNSVLSAFRHYVSHGKLIIKLLNAEKLMKVIIQFLMLKKDDFKALNCVDVISYSGWIDLISSYNVWGKGTIMLQANIICAIYIMNR